MTLERGASPATPHIVASVDTLQRRITSALRARLATLGITLRASHARILTLVGPEGTRPSLIAQGWISKQAIGQRVRELQELGLVTVERDPRDGRATVVRRTAEGDRLVERLVAGIADVEQELRGEVGAARYDAFRDVLDELVNDRLPQFFNRGV